MSGQKPIEVAVIGGGCASMAAAFELTRPERNGAYHVTVYQVGWRLGGKGASGRGPADRIEEHGLHIWMGFYENAFRLLRECYAELGRDPRKCRFADWRDAFTPAPVVGVTDQSGDAWSMWLATFPPAAGMPGDPLTDHNPFSVSAYLVRLATMLRITLESLQAGSRSAGGTPRDNDGARIHQRPREAASSSADLTAAIARLLRYGMLATLAGLTQALSLLEMIFSTLPLVPANLLMPLLDAVAAGARSQIEPMVGNDDEMRRLWEVIDVNLAVMTGIVRFGLLTDPRGFDAIDDYELRDWLRLNGASQRSLDSALIRGIYDLAFAYADGDFNRPCQAAGLAVRGSLRMFFTYRGAFFWRMQAAMGDVVFAPFYEVLKRRGVNFKFFHRLTNVRVAAQEALAPGERPYVEALEFDVQAEVKEDAEYRPLIDVRGLPCWPSRPDYDQLIEGDRIEREGRNFESHWNWRSASKLTLRVREGFDAVVLGVGLGEIPHVCRELIAHDQRWRDLVTQVKTVATQAFQLWMREDMAALGWEGAQTCVSGFFHPFDTWADMRHLIAEESWPAPPRAIAYFCSALAGNDQAASASPDYPAQRRDEVRRNAIAFLNHQVGHLWPKSAHPAGGFRWELLLDARQQVATAAHRCTSAPIAPAAGAAAANANGAAGSALGETACSETGFDSQFWTANVNPSDRYVQSQPGTTRFRLSPLDNTYDNLTVAGDWTACGLNVGCVEAAVISGRLAAHAISSWPALSEIVGYDHP